MSSSRALPFNIATHVVTGVGGALRIYVPVRSLIRRWLRNQSIFFGLAAAGLSGILTDWLDFSVATPGEATSKNGDLKQ